MRINSRFIKISSLLFVMTFITDGWALNMRPGNPAKSKNCENIKSQFKPFEDLVHKIVRIEDESRDYKADKFNRSTMRLYCGSGAETELLGAVNLIHNGTRLLFASHSLTTEDTGTDKDCKTFRSLKGCYALDTGSDGKSKVAIKLDNAKIKGTPNCIVNIEDTENELAELSLESAPQGFIPYTVGKGSELVVGSKIKFVAAAAHNFGRWDDYRRVVQEVCTVIEVGPKSFKTDCDGGSGSSGGVALDELGQVVGLHTSAASAYDHEDGLKADKDYNYNHFVIVDNSDVTVVN